MRLGGYLRKLAGSAIGLRLMAGSAAAEEITVGTVNNGDMIIMQTFLLSGRRTPATR